VRDHCVIPFHRRPAHDAQRQDHARRLLKDVAEDRALDDTTPLADPTAVGRLKDDYEAKEG
jgi:hypothetical protein